MNIIKKIIKNNKKTIIAFTLGAILFSGITGVIAYSINANQIEYKPSWTKENGENITNVKDAIDELYNKSNMKIYETGEMEAFIKYESYINIKVNTQKTYNEEDNARVIIYKMEPLEGFPIYIFNQLTTRNLIGNKIDFIVVNYAGPSSYYSRTYKFYYAIVKFDTNKDILVNN